MFSSPIPKRIELEQWDCPQMEALSSGPRIFFYFDVLEKFLRILVVRLFFHFAYYYGSAVLFTLHAF